MNKEIGAISALLLISIVLFSNIPSLEFGVGNDSPIIQQVGSGVYPCLDDIYFVEGWPWQTALTMAKEGKIDNFVGAVNTQIMDDLLALGWNVTMSPGFHMACLGINCRDVQPPWDHMWYDYHGRTPGFQFYPLNISSFRLALQYIVGCQKSAWLSDIYKYISVRLDQCVPPAMVNWYNPSIPQYPEDWAFAVDILVENGFTYDVGADGVLNAFDLEHDSTDDIWYMPNGDVLVGGKDSAHRGSDRCADGVPDGSGNPAGTMGIYVMSPGEEPTSVEVTRRYVKKWNEFFLGEQIEGINEAYALYHHEIMPVPTPTDPPIVDVTRYNRNHDIYFGEWDLGRDPDYLYDFFHPDVDIEGGDNSAGLVAQPLDDYLYALKYWMWPNGTEINDIEVMRQVCWGIQEMLYDLCPYLPVFSRNYINLYKQGLTGWVESFGYGSAPHQLEMPWTYCNIHWEDQSVGGSVKWHIPGPVTTLNPLAARSTYEWTILNRIYDSLIVVNASTHEDMPWAATNWTTEPYTNETEGVTNGMKIKFWLCHNMTWHDGDPVTADDIIWNWDFIKSVGFPELYDVSSTYIRAEKIEDDEVEVYVNATGLWKLYAYSSSALMFPKIVWEPFWGDYAGAVAFKPWKVDYETWTGRPPPANKPYLTCLYGTGPYCFHNWNPVQYTGLLRKFGEYAYRWLELRPIAQFTYSPKDPVVGKTVTFDASDSFDPDGYIWWYFWDFGDGSPFASGVMVPHIYEKPGNYKVTLEVIDNDGLSDTESAMVHVVFVIKVKGHRVPNSGLTREQWAEKMDDWLKKANSIYSCSLRFENLGVDEVDVCPITFDGEYIIEDNMNQLVNDKQKNSDAIEAIHVYCVRSYAIPNGWAGTHPDQKLIVIGHEAEHDSLSHEFVHWFGDCALTDHVNDPNNIGCTWIDGRNVCNAELNDTQQEDVRANAYTWMQKIQAIKDGQGTDPADPTGDVAAPFLDLSFAETWAENKSNWILHFSLSVFSFLNTTCELGFLIESDSNVHTGNPHEGIDYYITLNPAENNITFKRYDFDWTTLDPTEISYRYGYFMLDAKEPGVPMATVVGVSFSLPLTLLDRRAGNALRVRAVAHNVTLSDQAPDTGFMTILLPNIATTNITSSKTVVGSGYSVSINVTVHNQGGAPETFNVTAYANTTVIGTIPDSTLTNETLTTLTFTWNTSGFAKGNYTISAYAWPIIGETDFDDNNCTDGWVTVTIPGDINGDGMVFWQDLLDVLVNYGKTVPPAPPNTDINNDNQIFWQDLLVVLVSYGTSDP